MKEKVGQIKEIKEKGVWIARVCYKNTNGKKTSVQRTAKDKSEARKLLKELIEKLQNGGRKAVDAEKMTFKDLADYYEKHYVKPAKFIDNRKIEGMRNYKRVLGFLKVFRAYFSQMKIKEISYEQILAFRNHRLTVPTHYKKNRDIATMNRELSNLRRIFNIAIRQGWLLRNPINAGEPLIDRSAERRRERILTLNEEIRLLNACTGKREHIKPFIICLLDTGARRGEMTKLKFSDLDFQNRLITFQALNTKTLKERQVGMTNRVFTVLLELFENSKKNLDSFVFKFKDIKRSFESACIEAGIPTGRPFGITLHSLRHTAATRLINGQLPIQIVGRILGHSEVSTTYRYISANSDSIMQATNIFESLQNQVQCNDSAFVH
jgi:integrase